MKLLNSLKKKNKVWRRRRKMGRKLEGAKAFSRKYTQFFKHMVTVFIIFSTTYVLHQIIFVSEVFKIDEIVLAGDSTYINFSDLQNVVEGAAIGKNIFTIRSFELSETLSKAFLVADEIAVQKKLPNKLFINIKERTPVAVVSSEEDYIVDTEGFVLGIADENFETFPRIEYEDNVLVGRFLDENMVPLSMEILQSADINDLKISSMSFSEKHSTVYLDKGEEILLGNQKSISKSMEIVAAMLRKLSLEGKNVGKIDLRYDKVVVSY